MHSSLSRIVTNALDCDPSLIPISCKSKFNISATPDKAEAESDTTPEGTPKLNKNPQSDGPEDVDNGPDPGDTKDTGASPTTPDGDDPLRDPDDFVFESEAQAVRMSKAIREAFDVELTPEVIIADANLSALANRILITRDLLSD